jgi:hypothetical protein
MELAPDGAENRDIHESAASSPLRMGLLAARLSGNQTRPEPADRARLCRYIHLEAT